MRTHQHETWRAAVWTLIGISAYLSLHVLAQSTTQPATNPAGATTRPVALVVTFEDVKSTTLDAAAFAKLPRHTIEARNRDGVTVSYSGVELWRLLDLVEAPSGPTLRGDAMAHYIVAEGSDGYRVTLSIAETDDAFGERQILVADQLNGQPLPENAAPLQLIVPQDARQGRWVRMLDRIEVRRVP